MGVVTRRIACAIRQRDAIAEIQAIHGSFLYDYQYAFTLENGGAAEWKAPRPAPLLLRLTFGEDMFARVVYVQLTSPQTTDATLPRLAHLNNLHQLHLNLDGSSITDASVEFLSSLREPRLIDVRRTNVTHEGVRRLRAELRECTVVATDADLPRPKTQSIE